MCATKKKSSKNSPMCSLLKEDLQWLCFVSRRERFRASDWILQSSAVLKIISCSLVLLLACCTPCGEKKLFMWLYLVTTGSLLFVFLWSLDCRCSNQNCVERFELFAIYVFFYESTMWNKDLMNCHVIIVNEVLPELEIYIYIQGFNCWSASVNISRTQMIVMLKQKSEDDSAVKVFVLFQQLLWRSRGVFWI